MRTTEGTCSHCSAGVEWSEDDSGYAATDPSSTLSGVWLCPDGEPHNIAERESGIRPEHYALANRHAGLGVGHVWTATHCPAYRTYDPESCICHG